MKKTFIFLCFLYASTGISQIHQEENIGGITVKPERKKYTVHRVGDLRKPSHFLFFKNTNYSSLLTPSTKKSNLFLSYIANPKNKNGFIEKVFIKLSSKVYNPYETDMITGKKSRQYDTLPSSIRLSIACYQTNSEGVPEYSLSSEEMIFEIKNYKSQWLDISNFNVPFPADGAYVGMRILEVKGSPKSGGVSIPYLFAKDDQNPDYNLTSAGWIKRPRTAFSGELSKFMKSRQYTYGYGAEVSFEK